MELKNNNIVVNNRGDYGVVVSFNNTPCLLVFNAYTMQLSRFNEKLECKNDNYSIKEVYEFKENVEVTITAKDVFSRTFSVENAEYKDKLNQVFPIKSNVDTGTE